MAEIKVICPECGKQVSLRGLNGHLRFDHDYELEQAKRMAAGISVDGRLNRLEQDVMDYVRQLYRLKEDAEQLRQAKEEGLIGEQLYERMITQKGHELTATTRYLQRLEGSWRDRVGQVTGVVPPDESEEDGGVGGLLEEIESARE